MKVLDGRKVAVYVCVSVRLYFFIPPDLSARKNSATWLAAGGSTGVPTPIDTGHFFLHHNVKFGTCRLSYWTYFCRVRRLKREADHLSLSCSTRLHNAGRLVLLSSPLRSLCRWYKEGSTYPLEAETRSGDSRDSVTTAVLTLMPARGDDGAGYRCVVWNRAMPEGSKLEAKVTLGVNCECAELLPSVSMFCPTFFVSKKYIE
jgi:hypothetical protein